MRPLQGFIFPLFALAIAAPLTGCGGSDTGNTEPVAVPDEDSGPDATDMDATGADAAEPDAAKPDATGSDAGKPDAKQDAKPDAKPDAAGSDATGNDAQENDAQDNDAAATDAPATDAPEDGQQICTPGQRRCQGNTVYECEALGQSEKLVQNCGTWECLNGVCLCDSDDDCSPAEYCNAGSCVADACAQGTLVCVSNDVHQCNANGSASALVTACGQLTCKNGVCICEQDTQCESGQHCATNGWCAANVCTPSSKYCKGSEAWACASNGASETLVSDCSPLACQSGACVCTDSAQCQAAQFCDQGSCVADVCQQGQPFCQNGDVYLCVADGSKASLEKDCGTLLCQAGSCYCSQDDQCPALMTCSSGACVPAALSGVYASSLDVLHHTGESYLNVDDVVVSAAGQITFLLSAYSYGAINAINVDIAQMDAGGQLSIFLTAGQIATHMGESISQVVSLAYCPNGDLIAADYLNSWDVLRIEPNGTMHTVYTGAQLLSLLGLTSLYDIGYSPLVACDTANNVYYWAPEPATLVKIASPSTGSVLHAFAAGTEGQDMVVTPAGTAYLYTNLSYNGTLWSVSTSGTTTAFMTEAEIAAQAGGTVNLTSLAINAAGNTMYAYESNGDRILRITTSKVVQTAISSATVTSVAVDANGDKTFLFTEGLAVEPSGSLLATFYDSDMLVRFFPATDTAEVLATDEKLAAFLGTSGSPLKYVAASPDTVYAWDSESRSLLRLDGGPQMTTLATSDDFAQAAGGYSFTPGALSRASNDLLYLGYSDVMSFHPTTSEIKLLASATAIKAVTAKTYVSINALAASSAGDVWAFDTASKFVLKVTSSGVVSKLSDLTSIGTLASVGGIVYDETRSLLYATETSTDQLLSIHPSTGVWTTTVSKTAFQTVTGAAFTAGALAHLADGNLILFDEQWYSGDNPERIVKVNPDTAAVSILIDQADLRSANGGKPVNLANLTYESTPKRVLGFDKNTFRLLYWSVN